MKISDAYTLRELDGRGILLPEKVSDPSRGAVSCASRVFVLSSSAYWLLRSFEGREFTSEQAVEAVCAHFDVDRATAEADMAALLFALGDCGVLE